MNDQSAAKNDDATSVDVDLGTDKAAGAKEAKTPKAKLVRDSFTIPKAEYTTLNELRQRSTRLAQPAKKSEILRAGIELLKGLSDQAFLDALAAVPNLKTGRPKKEGEEGDASAVRTGRRIIDKIAKRPAKGATKAGEEGVAKANGAKVTKSPAQKAIRAAKKAAGPKAKGGKAGMQAGKAGNRAGNKAGKAGKPQRASRPADEDEADEV
jgi:hypothetical protein